MHVIGTKSASQRRDNVGEVCNFQANPGAAPPKIVIWLTIVTLVLSAIVWPITQVAKAKKDPGSHMSAPLARHQ
jgi:hypothetical protein